jgi:hypothetical protein
MLAVSAQCLHSAAPSACCNKKSVGITATDQVHHYLRQHMSACHDSKPKSYHNQACSNYAVGHASWWHSTFMRHAAQWCVLEAQRSESSAVTLHGAGKRTARETAVCTGVRVRMQPCQLQMHLPKHPSQVPVPHCVQASPQVLPHVCCARLLF